MKVTEECFSKVKKDCFKFIKSQETSSEKFGNKDGMLKSFLIPVCFYIFKTRELRNEFIEKTKGMNKESREQIYKEYQLN